MNSFRLEVPVDVKLGLTLPASGSPHVGQKVRIRPGAMPKEIDVADIFKDIPGLTDPALSNYSIASAAVSVEYSTDTGTSWANLADAVGGVSGLEQSEITIDTSKLLSDGTFTIQISDGAVPSDILAAADTRIRLVITLTDDAPAPSGQ